MWACLKDNLIFYSKILLEKFIPLPSPENRAMYPTTPHGGFLERVYESELDTKTEYEGF
jgi:hypothetical protein